MKKTSFFLSQSEGQTSRSAEHLALRIKERAEWCKLVLLSGEMGSGKTIFSKAFLRTFKNDIKPKSPTFTIIEEYGVGDLCLVHVDLYRLGKNKDPDIYKYLQEKILDKNAVLIIEWAENLLDFELPEHRIELDFEYGEGEFERKISFRFVDKGYPDIKQVRGLLDEFKTPLHVQHHSKKVANLGIFMASNLSKQGILVDEKLVYNSGLLHDLVRLVNFPKIDFENGFIEEITEEKKAIWLNQWKKYKNIHHAELGADILKDRGFMSCADMIRVHRSRAIESKIPTLEEKIIYISDKKALHDKLVKVKERIEDAKTRHNAHNIRENDILSLGNMLLKLCGFKNEDQFDKEFLKWESNISK
ncbi:MAG: tRNA (adenosine(37)-N6)-threonylcarbamoyltransferase complex ATPase subunit type 1 TsaE [Candidatus Gracilibacteria bacterium]|nr:tRNA (adenosine(37)-N6)-threonylcarbamoyltransferase complex ATPase subunit type 1 TsaE [Candidatus Gracilibacteria bacterium]